MTSMTSSNAALVIPKMLSKLRVRASETARLTGRGAEGDGEEQKKVREEEEEDEGEEETEDEGEEEEEEEVPSLPSVSIISTTTSVSEG